MKVAELIEVIGSERQRLNAVYSQYKSDMVELQKLKDELQLMLGEAGLKSAKSTNYGVSIATRKSISVESEQSVKEWLENTPDIEADAYIGLKLTPFKKFAAGWFQETGEIIPGTEPATTESVTIKANK